MNSLDGQIIRHNLEPDDTLEVITSQPELCLLPAHLAFARRLIESISQYFEHDNQYLQGMDFRNMYPITYEDGITGMMVKQSRLDVNKLFTDIQIEEQAALKLGITCFAPSYLVNGLIVQKLLQEDINLSAIELSTAKEAFFNNMMSRVGDPEGISHDNIVITIYGPVIIDVRSYRFSKLLKKNQT